MQTVLNVRDMIPVLSGSSSRTRRATFKRNEDTALFHASQGLRERKSAFFLSYFEWEGRKFT